ncbi:MAG: VTT domain-containing protein [Polyangiales bacterium]
MNNPWLRLTLLAVLLAGIYAIGRATGFTEALTVDGIRESIRAAGVRGFAVFVAIFCIGQLLYVPGFVFVMVSGLAYGPLWGSIASMIAATISVAVSFIIVRTIGGQPLKSTHIERSFLQKPLDRLEQQPIRSMVVIRLFLWAIPPVNYTLAMSGVTFRDYMIAAVIGLTPPFVTLSVAAGLGFNLLK